MSLDLIAIMGRYLATTPGEWVGATGDMRWENGAWRCPASGLFKSARTISAVVGDSAVAVVSESDWDDERGVLTKADRDWIIACRTDVPALVAEVELLRTELAERLADAAEQAKVHREDPR